MLTLRRALTPLAALVMLLQLAGVAPARAAEGDTQPNVVLIMSDDQGWGDVGFNGHPDLKTPHLDAMAANGVAFNRFYTASSICSPTRASCLTGRYPYRSGVLAAHTGGMREGEITIAEALQTRGYSTGFFGKWHLGWVKTSDRGSRGFYSPPWFHGYDQTFATTSAVPTWNPGVTPEGWNSWGQKENTPWKEGAPYVLNGEPVTENMEGDDSRIIMDRVIPFIEENASKPFFATVWFHAPHEPVVAGPRHRAMYADFDEDKQHYYGCITAMDEQIGRLREKLRELGIEKNTVLFFCSDNGPNRTLARKGVASTGPFKGAKHTMYEGGILVPAVAEWPGVIEPGQKTDARCATTDFFPTITKIAGYKFSKRNQRPIDGYDLMAAIQGDIDLAKRELFSGYQRLVQGIDGVGLIHGNLKLVREAKKDGRVRLYDIVNDPYEKKDLADSRPKDVKRLIKRLMEIEESCRLSRDGADYRY